VSYITKTSTIYISTPADASQREYWEMVRGSLEDAGLTDIRPAPTASLAFVPRQLRAPVLLSSAEV
jgi:hypothetical protein